MEVTGTFPGSDDQTIDQLNLNGNNLELSLENDGQPLQTVDLSSINSVQAIIEDADNDTKIQVEESNDDDIIRMDIAGTEVFRIRKNPGGETMVELPSSGDNSTFFGHSAGAANTTGFQNTFIGKSAGQSNTTGFLNTFLGYHAGKSSNRRLQKYFYRSGCWAE